MKMFWVTLFLTTSAVSVAAQSPMTAAEFDAYTRDKTFYYGNQGQAYGAEEYLENQRVIWSFLDGKCQDGIWYQQGEMICFIYDGVDDPQCWSFTQSAGGLVARFQNDPEQIELYEVEKSHEPMLCLGPEIGVKFQISDYEAETIR